VSRRLVIANRGEIARRILRAARARGDTVAVISTPDDAESLVRREVDAVLEVPGFLALREIVDAAVGWQAQLLHPGYGFLAESADFARAVEDAGIVFIGPTSENMRALGGKESAKAIARRCGVPTLAALLSHELARLPRERWGAELAARGIVAPFLVKASGGGGGRGMRVAETLEALPGVIERASQEALAGFGDGTVFVERYLQAPRHVEVQVFGDGRGGGVFLGERECSLQRRHQKVLEESPSPVVDETLREALGRAALSLVRETRYRSAGTVEFLLDEERQFHFLEMNTRLQVEHPVTELVLGVDLVQAQLELAEGRFPGALGDPSCFSVPRPRGVALEARILAEDPRNGFLPTPGLLVVYREPAGEGVRVDSGVCEGGRILDRFDSMIAKLVVWGHDRAQAVSRLSAALEDFTILGCATNLPFLQAVSRHPDYLAGTESTAWIGANLEALNAPLMPAACREFFDSKAFRESLSCAFRGVGEPLPGPASRFAAVSHAELRTGSSQEKAAFRLERGEMRNAFTLRGPALRQMLERSGDGATRHECGPGLLRARAEVQEPGLTLRLRACRLSGSRMALALFGETLTLEDPLATLTSPRRAAAERTSGTVRAPMAGSVVEVRVAEGDAVEEGQVLFVVESMKMQFEVAAPLSGRVASVLVERGQTLPGPEPMATLEETAGE
jgi:acetyl/propionyl-CoA carboxylase alpha subunit